MISIAAQRFVLWVGLRLSFQSTAFLLLQSFYEQASRFAIFDSLSFDATVVFHDGKEAKASGISRLSEEENSRNAENYCDDAIRAQVILGKNAMLAFGGRLNSTQIEDVTAYVLDQSAKW